MRLPPKQNAKSFRMLTFRLETLNYDQTVADIETLVEMSGGYIESGQTARQRRHRRLLPCALGQLYGSGCRLKACRISAMRSERVRQRDQQLLLHRGSHRLLL